MLYSEYYQKRTNEVDYKFINWINRVETQVKKKLGMGLLDLSDQPYMICFENGVDVKQMVSQVLETGF